MDLKKCQGKDLDEPERSNLFKMRVSVVSENCRTAILP